MTAITAFWEDEFDKVLDNYSYIAKGDLVELKHILGSDTYEVRTIFKEFGCTKVVIEKIDCSYDDRIVLIVNMSQLCKALTSREKAINSFMEISRSNNLNLTTTKKLFRDLDRKNLIKY